VSKQTLGTKQAEMKILDSLLKFNFFSRGGVRTTPLSLFSFQQHAMDLGKRM